MEIFQQKQTQSQLEETFKMVDEDNNGTIEKSEMRKHINSLLYGEADVD